MLSTIFTRLRILAETCQFYDENEEIRDHFVTSCCSKSLKQKLLKETDLTLEKCINIGRSTELVKKQAAQIESVEIERRSSNEIKTETLEEKIDKLFVRTNPQTKVIYSKTESSKQMGYRCGDQYVYGHNKICKANGKTCFNCSQKNHFSSCCKNRKQGRNHAQSNFIVENSISGSELSESELLTVCQNTRKLNQ